MMTRERQSVVESECSLLEGEYHPMRSKEMDNEVPC